MRKQSNVSNSDLPIEEKKEEIEDEKENDNSLDTEEDLDNYLE